MTNKRLISTGLARTTAIGILGAVGLLLTSCSGVNPVNELMRKLDPFAVKIGESQPLIDNGVVTDEFGTYQRTTINPSSVVVDSTGTGLIAGDAESAKNFVVNFVAAEVMDSVALDNANHLAQWWAEVAPKYVHSAHLAELQTLTMSEMSQNTQSYGFGLIANNAAGDDAGSPFPTLLRDEKPRVADKSFESPIVISQSGLSPESFNVALRATEVIYVDDTNLFQSILKNIGSTFVDAEGNPLSATKVEEMLREPYLEDDKPQAGAILVNYTYTLAKEAEQWKIVSYSGSFERTGLRFADTSGGYELSYRNHVNAH